MITAPNSSCGKVMFSQACVKNSVQGGSMHGRGECIAGETATAANGTHPTGMHSNFDC